LTRSSRGAKGALAAWAAAAVFGLFVDAEARRVRVGETAVHRFRAHAFGAGRHTRFDGQYAALLAEHGAPTFETAAPWLGFGPTEVEVRFAGAPAGRFSVDETDVRPVDAAAEALARRLREADPLPPPKRRDDAE
jgi:hypothetical protein